MLIDRTQPHLDVTVKDRPSMDEDLNRAMGHLLKLAPRTKTHGLLITRLRHGHFTVGFSRDVPFGYTREQDHRSR
ncbi:hypothetical protein ACHMXB_21975 (plasmid) [Arthrobacter sp. UC242_113]|uniref:hypothetical protein n=1 Tax=Arthrobacter sp. UC242_113 TaxID=3374550 RepID=UPI0037580717